MPSRGSRIPFALALAGVATALSWSASPPRPATPAPAEPAERAAAPEPEPAQPAPEEAVVAITELTVGRAPYTWEPPDANAERWRVLTFVTDSATECRLSARATVRGPDDAAYLRWEIDPPAGFELPEDAELTGQEIEVVLARETVYTGGGPLTLTVRAWLEEGAEDWLELVQDERDELRQEYVDLSRNHVPARGEFIDEAEYNIRYARAMQGITFQQLNASRNRAAGRPYRWAILSEDLLASLARLQQLVDRPLWITSVYRNPVHQQEVNAPVSESHHQYGRAADLYVWPDWAPPHDGRGIATPADWLRLANAAVEAGARWLEPMTLTNVYTDRCHLHFDVRPGGEPHAPLTLGRAVHGALRPTQR